MIIMQHRRKGSRWNLISARKEKKLSVKDVSRLTNYSEAVIMLAENGHRYNGKLYKNGRQFWETMSKLYDKPIEWLMEKDDML